MVFYFWGFLPALELQRLTLHWSHGLRKCSSCSMAQAKFRAGEREQSFAGSSRPRGIFPIKRSDFSCSEKDFMLTVIGRKSHTKIGLKFCTHCQLKCKLPWENLQRSAVSPCRKQRNWWILNVFRNWRQTLLASCGTELAPWLYSSGCNTVTVLTVHTHRTQL